MASVTALREDLAASGACVTPALRSLQGKGVKHVNIWGRYLGLS